MAKRDMTGAIHAERLLANAGGDAGLADEVLGLFAQQAELWLRLLDDATGADGFRDAAHSLKGTALGVGATDMADACARAEAGADGDLGVRSALARRVRDEAARALADAAAWRHERLLQSLRTPARG